jgi:hypothetical protein
VATAAMMVMRERRSGKSKHADESDEVFHLVHVAPSLSSCGFR